MSFFEYAVCDGHKFVPVVGSFIINGILRQQMELNL
jgi:hypothetical protein